MSEWFLSQEHVTLHVTTDPTLEEEPDGEIRHRCTVLVFRGRNGGYVLASVGQYDDAVVRTSA